MTKTALPRREQIVRAALTLLADIPLSRLSTRQIAASVGLSQPALFRHFPTREDLILAVLAHAREGIATRTRQALEDPSTPSWQRLGAVARALLSYVETHPGLPALLFGEASAGEERLRRALAQIVLIQHALASEVVRVGQGRGELSTATSPEHAATLFVGLVQGVVVQWRLEGRPAGLTHRLDGPLTLLGVALGVDSAAMAPPPAQPPRKAGADHLDVRPLLDAREEPLPKVLSSLRGLERGSLLAITAPFRPKPLIALLRGAGHQVHEEPLEGGLHVLVVTIEDPGAPLLDLRDLEPPEPLEQVLLTASTLEPGASLRAWLPRYPRLLIGHLDARELHHDIAVLPDDTALLFLTRPT